MLTFVAPINYENIFTTKISRFTVSIETATAMHTKGTESKRSIFLFLIKTCWGQPPVSLGVEG